MSTSQTIRTNATKLGFSVREICNSYGLSKGFVQKEIRVGKLNARRLGRRVVVLASDLERYLDQSKISA